MPPRRVYHDGYGSYESGNLPYWNQQRFDLGERIAEELAQKTYQQLPSAVSQKRERHNRVGTNLDALVREYDAKRKSEKNPYSIAQKEIGNSFQTKTHEGIKPALEAAGRSPFAPQDSEFMNQFDQRYNDIGKSVLDEMTENYLKNIVPKVQGNRIQRGTFNNTGGTRHELDSVLKGLHKDVNRNLTHLKARGLEHGLEEVHKHKMRGLEAAQLGSNVQEKEKESTIRGAQALQDAERGQHIHDISALDQQRKQAAEEQAHEEALLREQQERAKDKQEFAVNKLAQEAQLISGLPATHVSHVGKITEPRPANPYETGAGIIGQMVGLMHNQKAQTIKTGGSVQEKAFHKFQKLVATSMVRRRCGGSISKYAPGGAVSYEPNAGMTPEIEKQLAVLQQMQRSQGTPMGNAFWNMGSHILSKTGSDEGPMASFGEASKVFRDTLDTHENKAFDMKAKEINLLSDINQSRQRQQELVREHEFKNKSLAETSRLHDAQIAREQAHANYYNQQTKALGTSSSGNAGESGYLPKGFHESTELKERIKAEGKAKERYLEQAKAIDEAQNHLNIMKDASEKLGPTGPVAGILPNKLVTFNDPEKIANRRVFEQEAVSNVLDALNKMKGVQSDKDMEYIKRTAVSLSDDPATIKAWFKKTQSLIDRGKQGKQFIDEAVSKGMSREEAEKSYHDWAINNPLVYKGAEKTQNVKSHHNKTPLTPAEARMALQMGAGQ
jgi:hypothetical protein